MKFRLIIGLFLIVFIANSQVVTTNPTFPEVTQAVTITFHADQGSAGLKDYAGDIYAHAGVITSESTGGGDWKYVIAGWSENTDKAKLTRVDANTYTLEIGPSIIEFYGVEDSERVEQLVFVFRNEDGSLTGKTAESNDIFIDVTDPSLSALIVTPANEILVKPNEEIEIEVASNYADSLILYVDNERITATTEDKINTQIMAKSGGRHWIWIEAKDATSSVYDSVSYFIRGETTIVEMPIGVHKGINYLNDTTVTLVLHAPEKEFSYLIGDFNDWDFSLEAGMYVAENSQVTPTTWMMNMTPDSTHHWITLTHLEPQKEYAFQYYIDGGIKIADPYTEKVLDQWNDPSIDEDTYPGLIEYPFGKTNQPTAVLQTAQVPFEWQINNFEMPAVEDMVIYEMLIRDFVETHTYKTIADTLDYLQNLGVNVLELMPINEFEGNSSWGYNPSFYFAPDKYYGPKEELKKLIDECHKRGMAVVIDMVLNHSYGQSPLVRMYFENGKPASNNPWYNENNNFTNPDAHWGYDFNHESPYTQELVDSINAFWMGEYNVDGFRFDFTKGFGNNIKDASDSWGSKYDADRIRLLKRMADEIWERKPTAYISFEHLSENSEETELANYGINLWGNMNNNYGEAVMGYTESGKSDLVGISYQQRGWSEPRLVGYMESHDEPRLMYKNITWGKQIDGYDTRELKTALSRMHLAANFFFTIPGPKMIWQFGELGYDIDIDLNGRVGEKPILWDYFEDEDRKRVYEVYSALANLKVTEPAFSTTDFVLDVRDAVKTIQLNHSDMNVMVVGNFDVEAQTVTAEFQNSGTWYEYYTGESVEITNNQLEFSLAPGKYRLYTTKQLEIPEITPSVKEANSIVLKGNLRVYPNPVKENLHFADGDNLVQVTVMNISGRIVYSSKSNSGYERISVQNLENGVYIISAIDKKGVVRTSQFAKH
ncbi:MAG: alpha-amylase family glycosyl hydrolase [Salinivirgaceae bacterium]|jgi:1,4-alpha-glucan branching enzyme|nr:alpha-amylase family glycosyl hydrolase [Salinivirgaceae bacterium]